MLLLLSMNIEVLKFDNNGRGLGYYKDKIIFIPKTVPGDIVNCEILLEKKDHYEGKVESIDKPSKMRVKPICPYYEKCGGCDLMHISLSNMLEYKLEMVNDLLKRNKIDYKVNKIIKSKNQYNYRNKVSLKITNSLIGYYEYNTHKLIPIDYCYLCSNGINNIIKDIKKLNIIDGDITIRSNYKDEILLIINSNNNITIVDELLNNHKIVGIILNDKCIYGDNYLIEKVGNLLFKISYNSFFQINNYICSKLFELIEDYTIDSVKLLDLYCGVGSLGIVSKAQKVLGIEIVENAISDALINKCFNKKDNIEFICSDTSKVTNKITNDYDTIILDPPRSGVDKKIINKIINENINNIIYISCNPQTLVRDLKMFEDSYKILNITLLDMFPNTKHIESLTILEKN